MQGAAARPLSWYLVCLCLSTAVPLLLLCAVTIWRFVGSEQARLNDELIETNAQLGSAVEREINARFTSARVLTNSRSLAVGDLAAFYDEAKDWAAIDGDGTRVFVVDAANRVRLDTAVSWAAQVEQIDTEFLRGTSSSRPVMSDFAPATKTDAPGLYVSPPAGPGSQTRYRVVVRYPVSRLHFIFAQQNIKPPYYASIVDRNGVIVSRSTPGDALIGKPMPNLDLTANRAHIKRFVNMQGVPVWGVYRSTAFGWYVTTGMAEAAATALVQRTILNFAMVAFVAFCLAAGFAFMFARRVAANCAALAESARRLGDRPVVFEDTTPVREFREIGDALNEASQRLAEEKATIEKARLELARTVEVRTEELAQKTDMFEKTLENMDQGLIAINEQGHISIFNQRARELLRLPPHLLTRGSRFDDILTYWTDHKVFKGSLARARTRQAEMLNAPQTYELEADDGSVLELRAVPLATGGTVRTYTDISARKTSEREAAHLARHDFLTGLPNRMLFRERFEQTLSHVARHGGVAAMLYLDLDLFKQVNDTHGHPVGDALLRDVAARIKGCLRVEDTIARIGGDEFAILQSAGGHPVRTSALARRLLAEIARPFEVDGRQLAIGASIGIVMTGGAGENTFDGLFKRADKALYRAKHEGRNCYAFAPADISPEIADTAQVA